MFVNGLCNLRPQDRHTDLELGIDGQEGLSPVDSSAWVNSCGQELREN
ncbi:MAG TPA: hypothetical protein VMY43_06250 [Methanothrix sp.]|nr:hypothetical protein [Methanothrix sp.]